MGFDGFCLMAFGRLKNALSSLALVSQQRTQHHAPRGLLSPRTDLTEPPLSNFTSPSGWAKIRSEANTVRNIKEYQ